VQENSLSSEEIAAVAAKTLSVILSDEKMMSLTSSSLETQKAFHEYKVFMQKKDLSYTPSLVSFTAGWNMAKKNLSLNE